MKTLEELGIGRPSTYAPTISTIIARRYVAKENKNLYLTELGEVVNNIMRQSFPSRRSLISYRLHTACHKPFPDQLIEAELISGERIFQHSGSTPHIRRADRLVGVLDLTGRLLSCSSVALRIIADREEEINAFIPEEYWSLDADFKVPGEKQLLPAKF